MSNLRESWLWIFSLCDGEKASQTSLGDIGSRGRNLGAGGRGCSFDFAARWDVSKRISIDWLGLRSRYDAR